MDADASVHSLKLASATTNGNPTLNVSGATLNVTESAEVVNSRGKLRLDNGSLNGALSNRGTTTIRGNSSISEYLDNSNGTLRIEGTDDLGNATLTVTSDLISSNFVELTSTGDAPHDATLAIPGGTLRSFSTLRSSIGSGGRRTIGASLINDSSLDVQRDLSVTGDLHNRSTVFIGDEAQLDVQGDFEPGNRFVLVVADGGRRQGESDEGNNTRAVPIQLSAPELEPSQFTVPSSAVLGDTLEISWTVTNQGSAEALSTFWSDRLYVSDDQFLDTREDISLRSESHRTGLAAGNNYTTTSNVYLSDGGTGDKFLILSIDDDNRQGETDESNNILVTPINLSASDLILENALAPTQVAVGEGGRRSRRRTGPTAASASALWSNAKLGGPSLQVHGTAAGVNRTARRDAATGSQLGAPAAD